MGEFSYVSDYKTDDALRASFNELTSAVFGFTLEEWYRLGCWDDHYVCHSIVHSGRVVANVSVTRMGLHIRGEAVNAAQIGTVATLEDYRGHGLSRKLMETAIEASDDCDFMFLFGHDGVKDFYPRFGFMPKHETVWETRLVQGHSELVVKLDPARPDHWDLISDLYRRRIPVSSTLGPVDSLSIFRFHCLYGMREFLFYLPESEVLVVAETKGDRMNVYDIVSRTPTDFSQAVSGSTFPGVAGATLFFCPDRFSSIFIPHSHHDDDSVLYVRGDFPLDGVPFKFPLTSQT